jgi:hypothetical protein
MTGVFQTRPFNEDALIFYEFQILGWHLPKIFTMFFPQLSQHNNIEKHAEITHSRKRMGITQGSQTFSHLPPGLAPGAASTSKALRCRWKWLGLDLS